MQRLPSIDGTIPVPIRRSSVVMKFVFDVRRIFLFSMCVSHSALLALKRSLLSEKVDKIE